MGERCRELGSRSPNNPAELLGSQQPHGHQLTKGTRARNPDGATAHVSNQILLGSIRFRKNEEHHAGHVEKELEGSLLLRRGG